MDELNNDLTAPIHEAELTCLPDVVKYAERIALGFTMKGPNIIVFLKQHSPYCYVQECVYDHDKGKWRKLDLYRRERYVPYQAEVEPPQPPFKQLYAEI